MIVLEKHSIMSEIEEILADIEKYGSVNNVHKIGNSIVFDYDNYSNTSEDVRITISPDDSGSVRIEGPRDIVNKIIKTVRHSSDKDLVFREL